jgi:hypothetical protein
VITFKCQQCGDSINAKNEMGGKSTSCPICGLVQKIPAAKVEPPTTIAPPPNPPKIVIPEYTGLAAASIVFLVIGILYFGLAMLTAVLLFADFGNSQQAPTGPRNGAD